MDTSFSSNLYPKLLILIGALYFLFGPIDIMDIDAAQYASISREMLETGNYLQVHQRGQDYLDKPPLLFWLASTSFNLFGISNFTYKLPAVLILLLGLFSTYKAARLFYSEHVAGSAMLILASTEAYLLMVNDVRTDGILTGFTIFSVWQLLEYIKSNKWSHFLLAALGIGLAMLSKGPLGAIIPAIAVGGHLLYKRDFKTIFQAKWLLIPLIVLVILSPMLYGLYQQYDLHPEKEVYGLKGPSGIKFFFWTQSFGRITGDIYWKDDSSPFFFLNSMAWDAQPWYIVGWIALVYTLILLIKNLNKPEKMPEAWTLAGFIIPFLALSSSNYKLPHYIFPLLPYFSIILAQFFLNKLPTFKPSIKNSIYIIQSLPLFLFPILVAFISIYAFELAWWKFLLLSLLYIVLFYFISKAKNPKETKIIRLNVMASFWAGIFLALHFYPNLLKYQGTAQIGKWAHENNIGNRDLFVVDAHSFSFDFYGHRSTPFIAYEALDELDNGQYITVTRATYLDMQVHRPGQFEVEKSFPNYSVSLLKLGFLNSSTRAENIDSVYVLKKLF